MSEPISLVSRNLVVVLCSGTVLLAPILSFSVQPITGKFFVSLSKHYLKRLRAESFQRLNLIYRKGMGVKPSERRADGYLKKAMELESPKAFVSSAKKFIEDENYIESILLLERAIKHDDSEANFLLGCLYFQGQGVPKNLENGWKYVTSAAKKGHSKAKLSIAIATLQGLDGSPTLEKAIQYATEAEAMGLPKAAEARRRLEKMRDEKPSKSETAGRSKSS